MVSHTIGLTFYSRLGVKQSQMLLNRVSPTFFNNCRSIYVRVLYTRFSVAG